MGLRNTFAVLKDAPTTQRKEDCASGTGQRDMLAATKGVIIKLLMEEFV